MIAAALTAGRSLLAVAAWPLLCGAAATMPGLQVPPPRGAAARAPLAGHATRAAGPSSRARGGDAWKIGLGLFDVAGRHAREAALRLEYRTGERDGGLRPWAGLEASWSGTLLLLGGVQIDIPVGAWAFTPSFGGGLYRGGGGRDLGHPLEFRTQLEVSRAVGEGARLGVAFSHASNGSLSTTNPGVEVVTLYLTASPERWARWLGGGAS